MVISTEKMIYIMKKVNHLEESGLLTKCVNETIKMNQKNRKEDLLECY